MKSRLKSPPGDASHKPASSEAASSRAASSKAAPAEPAAAEGRPLPPDESTATRPAEAKAKAKAPAAVPLTPAEQDRVETVFVRFEAAQPAPRGELTAANPFTLVVAVALSAQATDKSVNKATEVLFRLADTPEKMVALGEARLIELIKTIGLYRTKARNVMALSRILLERYGGEVPLERQALQTLPGVGRKTASVVLNELRVEAAIAVDTHVFRVSHRLALSEAATPDGVELDLMTRIPERFRTRAHHWLILHGRYVCVARRPKCGICLVADLCPSRDLFLGA